MRSEIASFNERQPDKALILKIGVHKGAAIAVTLNDRLDYFGQTVNIAARVQNLADADEIFVSQDVYDAAGVRDELAAFAVEPRTAQLRGVQQELPVFRVGAAAVTAVRKHRIVCRIGLGRPVTIAPSLPPTCPPICSSSPPSSPGKGSCRCLCNTDRLSARARFRHLDAHSTMRSSMATRPPDASADTLFDLMASHRITAIIHVAARLGIADHLAAAQWSAAELARETGADMRSLQRLLRALVTIGICRETDERFELTEVGAHLAGKVRTLAQGFRAIRGRDPLAGVERAD